MENQMNIQKGKVLDAYKNGTQEQKELLETLFGEELFQPQDITELIKTFDDALKELERLAETGDETAGILLSDYESYVDNIFCKQTIASMRLSIICYALNEGWAPDWTNTIEWKYYPWFCLYTEDKYNDLDADDKERCCRVVGRSGSYASAGGGLVFAYASGASSYSSTSNGSRFAFKTRELALYAGKQFIELWCDLAF